MGLDTFEFLNKYGPRVANTIITTKQSILLMLYVSYIWDMIRKRYIHTRRIDHEEKYKQFSEGSRYPPQLIENQSLFDDDRSADYSLHHSQTIGRHSKAKRTIADYQSELHEQESDHEFDCAIPPKPKILKIYQIFSTIFMVYASIRYTLLFTIYYGWFYIDKSYACYLPGRVALLADEGIIYELYWIVTVIMIYHLIWRAMWHCSDQLKSTPCCFSTTTKILYRRNRKISSSLTIRESLRLTLHTGSTRTIRCFTRDGSTLEVVLYIR